MIRVKSLTRDNALSIHDLVVGDVIHVGMSGGVMLLLVVFLQRSEDLRGDLELLRRKKLVAHHQHMMVDERSVEGGARVAVDRPREVKADDLGAGMIRQGCDREGCHGRPPHWICCRRLPLASWRGQALAAPALSYFRRVTAIRASDLGSRGDGWVLRTCPAPSRCAGACRCHYTTPKPPAPQAWTMRMGGSA